jgi:predicted KAP-like P-loop ATPase
VETVTEPVRKHITAVAHDAPISDPQEDLLQRAEFAQQLADAIMQVNATEGFVIALNGPWGTGKTSVINLVRHLLKPDEKAKKIVVTEFKPWWFSGQEQLIKQYFRHLWSVFKRKDVPEGLQKVGDAFESIGNIFDKLSTVPNIPGTAGWLSKVFGALSFVFSSSARARQMDLDAWRDKVVMQLKKQEARLLVVIDDIDRLTADEMQQMFQVVKAAGNFPNTLYLLSFDTVVVERALEEVQCGSGREYLEKIVQLPFDLPQPDSATLHRLFTRQLDEVLAGTPEHLWKRGDWSRLFWDSIAPYLGSIRDVKRLINRLRATYPLVCGEVNGPEFVAFQTLYLFEPALVAYVRDNKESFTGVAADDERGRLPDQDAQASADKLLADLRPANAAAASATLRHLFPKWSLRAGHGGGFTADWMPEWRRERRIRHPEVFGLYFNLQIPVGDIGAMEMQSILDSASDEKALARQLGRLAAEKRPDGITRARVFLDKIQDYTTERIPASQIVPMLRALFTVGDELCIETDYEGGFASSDNAILILRVIYQLVKRFRTQQERFDAIRAGIERGTAVYTIVHEVAVRGQEYGKFSNRDPLEPEAQRSVSAAQLAELEAIALNKIRAAAADGSILRAPRLASILYSWKEWAGLPEPQKYVAKLIADDAGFVALVQGISGKGSSVSASEVKVWTAVDPGVLAEFTGLPKAELLRRATEILTSTTMNLTDKQREVLQVLVDNIRHPKNSWGDPISGDNA